MLILIYLNNFIGFTKKNVFSTIATGQTINFNCRYISARLISICIFFKELFDYSCNKCQHFYCGYLAKLAFEVLKSFTFSSPSPKHSFLLKAEYLVLSTLSKHTFLRFRFLHCKIWVKCLGESFYIFQPIGHSMSFFKVCLYFLFCFLFFYLLIFNLSGRMSCCGHKQP